MPDVPAYVSIVFILTTFAAIAFLLQSARAAGIQSLPSRLLIFLLPLWIFFQTALSVGGFYQDTAAFPPRVPVFAVAPALLAIASYFLFFRRTFIAGLPLSLLTLVHTVRIPVELVLYWLAIAGMVPQAMTFAGWNFDILCGILAPIVYVLGVRSGWKNRGILIAYNVLGLLLLINIVSIAVMALPTQFQQIAFDQPNRAVLYFPYIWLPAIVVPIVLFSHLSSLWQLLIAHPVGSKQ